MDQMKYRCPSATAVGFVNLEGYRLIYKGSMDTHAYLTIEKSNNSYVPVGVFKVTRKDIKSLDRYEGYPTFYRKEYFKVKGVNALIYVMNEQFEYHLPSDNYLKTCMQGYKDFSFDMNILNNALLDTIEEMNNINTKKHTI